MKEWEEGKREEEMKEKRKEKLNVFKMFLLEYL